MNTPKESTITIGELARRAGVTVRTLQYYDRTGLLRSRISESGRRLYTYDDVLRLQQILFFKSMGFSLEEIGQKILSRKDGANLAGLFRQQRDILSGQIENLREIIRMLDAVIPDIQSGSSIGFDRLMTIIDLMKKGNPYAFIMRYFNEGEFQSVSKRFGKAEEYSSYMETAGDVFAQLERLYRSGASPDSEEGQQLAGQWWKMVTDFTSDDPALLRPLLSAGMDMDHWPEEARGMKEAIENFLGKALDLYLAKKGIRLSEMEADQHE